MRAHALVHCVGVTRHKGHVYVYVYLCILPVFSRPPVSLFSHTSVITVTVTVNPFWCRVVSYRFSVRNMCIYLYLLRLRTVSTSTHATSTYCGHSRSLTCRLRPAHLVICADVSPLVQSLSVTGSQRFFKCTRNSSLNHEVPNGAFKEQKKVTH